MKKLFLTGLICTTLLLPVSWLAGCGGSQEAVKPEEFAPPPTEADEMSDETDG